MSERPQSPPQAGSELIQPPPSTSRDSSSMSKPHQQQEPPSPLPTRTADDDDHHGKQAPTQPPNTLPLPFRNTAQASRVGLNPSAPSFETRSAAPPPARSPPPSPLPPLTATPSSANGKKSLRLSPVDQASFRVYDRLLYVFRFPDASQRPRAEQHLRERLRACLKSWPWFGGEVVAGGETASGVEVRYGEPLLGIEDEEDGEGILTVRDLALLDGWRWSYEEMAAKRCFGEEMLDKDVLSNRPRDPEPGALAPGKGEGEGETRRGWPAFGLQVNWVEGGLVLCFAFHHQVVGGRGISSFLEKFAGAGKGGFRGREEIADRGREAAFQPRFPPPVDTRVPPEEYCFSHGIHVPLPDSQDPRKNDKNVSRILRFSASGLNKLKKEVEVETKREPSSLWISTTDCLGAIIWIGLIRARWKRGRQGHSAGKEDIGRVLRPEETTRFNRVANVHRQLKPRLPTTYMGNASVVAVATARVEDITGLGPNTTSPPSAYSFPQNSNSPTSLMESIDRSLPTLTIKTIANAASRIRQAMKSVGDAYIRRRFEFIASLCAPPSFVSNSKGNTPHDCAAALHRALDSGRTGIDYSSGINFPADLNFRIPGTDHASGDGGGRPAWVRTTYSASQGTVNVLPRRGGPGGKYEDEWEVLVAAAEEDVERMVEEMEEMEKDGGFMGFVGWV